MHVARLPSISSLPHFAIGAAGSLFIVGRRAAPTPPTNGRAGCRHLQLPALDYDAAQQTLAGYLDAWQDADYIAMYALLAPSVSDNLPFTTFRNQYLDTARVLTLQSIDTNCWRWRHMKHVPML